MYIYYITAKSNFLQVFLTTFFQLFLNCLKKQYFRDENNLCLLGSILLLCEKSIHNSVWMITKCWMMFRISVAPLRQVCSRFLFMIYIGVDVCWSDLFIYRNFVQKIYERSFYLQKFCAENIGVQCNKHLRPPYPPLSPKWKWFSTRLCEW